MLGGPVDTGLAVVVVQRIHPTYSHTVDPQEGRHTALERVHRDMLVVVKEHHIGLAMVLRTWVPGLPDKEGRIDRVVGRRIVGHTVGGPVVVVDRMDRGSMPLVVDSPEGVVVLDREEDIGLEVVDCMLLVHRQSRAM